MAKLSRRQFGVALSGAVTVLAVAKAAAAEPQPRMRSALRSLRLAERELAKADDDKGGHRVAALELVRRAIAETEAGIAFDNRH
jgi:hypothetical protein